MKITIPVIEEWNRMYKASDYFGYDRRPFQRCFGCHDFVTYSELYSKEYGEPVWFYSWGNSRWLRCPIGRPGDRLNEAGDYIAGIEVALQGVGWVFVVTVEPWTKTSSPRITHDLPRAAQSRNRRGLGAPIHRRQAAALRTHK